MVTVRDLLSILHFPPVTLSDVVRLAAFCFGSGPVAHGGEVHCSTLVLLKQLWLNICQDLHLFLNVSEARVAPFKMRIFSSEPLGPRDERSKSWEKVASGTFRTKSVAIN